MVWSKTALVEYLYGIRQFEVRHPDGTTTIVSQEVDRYEWMGKVVPAGFFRQPDTEHVSAVLANPGGTLSMFNRMGYLAGFGNPSLRMTRAGFCYRGKLVPEAFAVEVHAPGYSERWRDGVSVFHNPNALHPLPEHAFPDIAHHTVDGDRIVASMPDFFPLGSNTYVVTPS